MYCTKCGANIQDDSVFCPQCGNKVATNAVNSVSSQTTVNASYVNPAIKSRPDLITLAGMIDIVVGILSILLGVLVRFYFYPGTYFDFGSHMMGGVMTFYMNFMMQYGFLLLLLAGIPMIVAGAGLLSLQNWGRILHVIAWIPLVLMFPMGTLFGLLVIWMVYTSESNEYFETRLYSSHV